MTPPDANPSQEPPKDPSPPPANATPAARSGLSDPPAVRPRASIVEIVTMWLAIVGVVGAFYKFETMDGKLGKVQTNLTELQAERAKLDLELVKDGLLQVSGTIAEGRPSVLRLAPDGERYSHVRRATLAVELKNIGDATVQIDDIEVTVHKKQMGADWANIVQPPGAEQLAFATTLAPAPAAPVPPPDRVPETSPVPAPPAAAPAPATENVVPTPLPPPPTGDPVQNVQTPVVKTAIDSATPSLALGFLDTYSQGEETWKKLHAWKYDPKTNTGSQLAGKIRKGQTRSFILDYLIEDSETPEVLKLVVTVRPSSVDGVAQAKQMWIGWLGCGPLRGLFERSENPGGPGQPPPLTYPPAAAPAPEAPPAPAEVAPPAPQASLDTSARHFLADVRFDTPIIRRNLRSSHW